MVSRIANLIIRAIRVGLVFGCIFAVCRSAWAEATPAAKEGEATISATPVGSPPPSRSRSDCERYVAALSGRGDRELLDAPEVQDLARQAQDFVACSAISRKSSDLCKPVDPVKCTLVLSVFEELRANPKGRGFLFPDYEYEKCRADKRTASFCDALREATRTGDPDKCPAGLMHSFCRAFVSLDEAACDRISETEPENLDGAKRECKMQVRRFLPYAKGLKGMAESTSSPQREFAKAALGEADACASFEKKAMETCLAIAPAPAPQGTPGAGRDAAAKGAHKTSDE